MNAATLVRRTDEHGKAYLSGVVNYDIPKGTIVVLRRNGDDYELRAIDERRINTSTETLLSFIEAPDIQAKENSR